MAACDDDDDDDDDDVVNRSRIANDDMSAADAILPWRRTDNSYPTLIC